MSGFEGVRIIDLCQTGPGQMACSVLADLGADVISVQRPGFARDLGIEKVYSVGRNKRAMLVNAKDPRGKEIIYQLVRGADAVVEGFRPGVADRLGIGYEKLSGINPKIVYCALTGYGQDGPYRALPGHDVNFQGVAGMVPVDAQGKPYMPTNNWADRMGTLNLEVAILAALLARARTGIGQFVDVSYTDSSVTVPLEESLGHPLIERIQTGGPPGSTFPPLPIVEGRYPCTSIYECADGKYVALGASEKWFWERLCAFFGKPEWAPYDREEGPVCDEMFVFFRRAFREKPRSEWLRLLGDEQGNQISRVNIGREVLEDPHLLARGVVMQAEVPGGQKVWQIGLPFRFSAMPARMWRAATIAGEDTRAILGELGYSAAQVAQLEQDGVVEQFPEDFFAKSVPSGKQDS